MIRLCVQILISCQDSIKLMISYQSQLQLPASHYHGASAQTARKVHTLKCNNYYTDMTITPHKAQMILQLLPAEDNMFVKDHCEICTKVAISCSNQPIQLTKNSPSQSPPCILSILQQIYSVLQNIPDVIMVTWQCLFTGLQEFYLPCLIMIQSTVSSSQ